MIRVEVSGDGDAVPFADGNSDEWFGTGFVIHDDGTAVTNAHVASGADSLTVHLNGGSAAVSAKILGFAPCLDIAVIRLAGSGYRWLPWAERPHQRQPVWAVGHPDGRVDVHRSKGSVYDITMGEPDPLRAIRHQIMSTVPIKPGSSGSPLVDGDGAVVGVAYASAHENTDEAVAVSGAEVEPAVTRILQGHHPADIGVAGYADLDKGSPVAGVRVGDVGPRSLAKRSGLRPGDIITHIDGVRVSPDGVLNGYCRALRNHTGPEPVHVTIARTARNRRYEAHLGEEKLHAAGRLDVIDDQLLPIIDGHDGNTYEYTTVTDNTNTLRVDLPSAWSDVDDRTARGVGGRTPSLRASYDLDQYLETWATPGVTVLGSGDSEAFLLDGLLEDLDLATVTSSCVYEGRYPLRNAGYQGKFDLYSWCADAGLTVVVARLRPRERSGAVAVVMLLRTPRDLEALDRALDSLVLRP